MLLDRLHRPPGVGRQLFGAPARGRGCVVEGGAGAGERRGKRGHRKGWWRAGPGVLLGDVGHARARGKFGREHASDLGVDVELKSGEDVCMVTLTRGRLQPVPVAF